MATKVSNRNALILENERCARLPLASTLARCVPRGSHQLVKQCLFGFYRAPRCIQDISGGRDEGSKLLAMRCRELRQVRISLLSELASQLLKVSYRLDVLAPDYLEDVRLTFPLGNNRLIASTIGSGTRLRLASKLARPTSKISANFSPWECNGERYYTSQSNSDSGFLF